MSKPLIPGQPSVQLKPDEQVRCFVDLYRDAVNAAARSRLAARVRDLGLTFTEDELTILAALDTPARVQEFLNTQVYYNNDHASAELEETAMPLRRVLQTAHAHCFEGAMFAYAVDYLHGHAPRLVLLEASQIRSTTLCSSKIRRRVCTVSTHIRPFHISMAARQNIPPSARWPNLTIRTITVIEPTTRMI